MPQFHTVPSDNKTMDERAPPQMEMTRAGTVGCWWARAGGAIWAGRRGAGAAAASMRGRAIRRRTMRMRHLAAEPDTRHGRAAAPKQNRLDQQAIVADCDLRFGGLAVVAWRR